MNVYSAIMKAAGHIERNPGEFRWEACTVPKAPHCGTPGCAVGWTGFFIGARTGALGFRDVEARTVDNSLFYDRMDEMKGSRDWRDKADVCARVLRLYAEKYHGHEKPQRRPTSAMVADLMARVTAERIPEGMLESPEYGQ